MGFFRDKFKADPVVFKQCAEDFEAGMRSSHHEIGENLEVSIGISTRDKGDSLRPAPKDCTHGAITFHFSKSLDKKTKAIHWEEADQDAAIALITAIQAKLGEMPEDASRSAPKWQDANGASMFEDRVIVNPEAEPTEWKSGKRRNPVMEHKNIGLTIHFEAKSANELQQKLRTAHDTIMEAVHAQELGAGIGHLAGQQQLFAAGPRLSRA